jgi:hypothetical protein
MKKLLLIINIITLNCSILLAQKYNKYGNVNDGIGINHIPKQSTPEQDSLRKVENTKFEKLNHEIDTFLIKRGFDVKKRMEVLKQNTTINDSVDFMWYNTYGYTLEVDYPNRQHVPKWITQLKTKEYNEAIKILRKTKGNINLKQNEDYQRTLASNSYKYLWHYRQVYQDKYFNYNYHKTKWYWENIKTSYSAYLRKQKRNKKKY